MSATELQPSGQPTKCTFQRCIDYVDIARHSSASRRQTKVGWEKRAIFKINASIARQL